MHSKFGEFLYTLRKEKGLTQSELADKLGITNKAVSKWETGDAFPETAQLVPLATIFGVTVDELLRCERNPDNTEAEPQGEVEESTKVLKPFAKEEAAAIAAAIGFILIGVMTLIILAVNDVSYGIFVPILIGCVSVSVFTFIFIGLRRALRSAEISDKDYIKGKKISIGLALGVAVTISSVIPLISMEALGISERIYLPAFFAVLVIGVPLIIYFGIQWGNFVKLFAVPQEEDEMTGWAKKVNEVASSVIMLTATAIFLLLGFIKNMWSTAWIVFPVGGVLCGIASVIIKGLDKDR